MEYIATLESSDFGRDMDNYGVSTEEKFKVSANTLPLLCDVIARLVIKNTSGEYDSFYDRFEYSMDIRNIIEVNEAGWSRIHLDSDTIIEDIWCREDIIEHIVKLEDDAGVPVKKRRYTNTAIYKEFATEKRYAAVRKTRLNQEKAILAERKQYRELKEKYGDI